MINLRKRPVRSKMIVRQRHYWTRLIMIIVMLGSLFTNKSGFLSAYFTDVKDLNNAFSIDAEYTITFNSNGGTGTMAAQTVSYNVATPLNSNTFTRTGYNFTGWNTSADGTGTPYANGASINNLGDTELFAQWQQRNDCTITFNYGSVYFDGSNYINSGIPLFNSTNILRDFEISTTISNFEYNPNQNQNRNAIICNQYEGGNPYNGIAMMYRDGAIKIQGNSQSLNEGIQAWGKSSGPIVLRRTDEKFYYDNNYLVDFSTITRQFSAPLTFGANLDANGNPRRYSKVQLSDINVTLTYELTEVPSIVLPTPTKTNFTFDGWYTQPVGGTKITTPTVAQLANKTIYAHWASLTPEYTITFYSNGGTGTMNPQIVQANTPTPLNANAYTKTDYTFDKWNTAPDGSGTEYYDEEVVVLTGDLDLYAQWKEKTYGITFNYGDVSFVGTNYMNTDIAMFSASSYETDFEVSFNVDDFQFFSGQNKNRNSILASHYEAVSPYPGFSLSYREDANNSNYQIYAQGNCTRSSESLIPWGQTTGSVEFKRTSTKLYFNDSFVIDYKNNNRRFNDPIWFGASPDEHGAPRRYGDVDLSDIEITLFYKKSDYPSIVLPTPTLTGYTFDGWYTQAVGGTQVTSLTAADAESTIYAHWTPTI